MTISANYPTPVLVNGYRCHNCAEVAEAKKGIDPADPQAGPYGIDAKNPAPAAGDGPAVSFGGALSGLNAIANPPAARDPAAAGVQLDLSV